MTTLLMWVWLLGIPLSWPILYRALYEAHVRDFRYDYGGFDRLVNIVLATVFCLMWPVALLVMKAIMPFASGLEDRR